MKRIFAILAVSVAVCLSYGNANVGDYCSEDKKKCLQLKPDGKFVYVENKERFLGTYTVECDELSLVFNVIDEKSFSERVEKEKKYKTESLNEMIRDKCTMAAALGIPLEDLNGKRYNTAQIKQCIKDYEKVKAVKQSREYIKAMKLGKKEIEEIIKGKNGYFNSSNTYAAKPLIYKNSIRWKDSYGEAILTNGSAVDYLHKHKYYCSNGVLKEKENEFTDSRDGKKYKYVTIGNQTWMAENLDYHGKDGHLGLCRDKNIDETMWGGQKPENCEKYSRHYDWAETMGIDRKYNKEKFGSAKAKNHQGICPEGWHLPSDKEWRAIIDFAGGEEIAGKKLKIKLKSWEEKECRYTTSDDRGRATEHDECPTDEYGFSAGGCFFIPLEGVGKSPYLEETAAQGLCFSKNGNGVDITWDIISKGLNDYMYSHKSYGGTASSGGITRTSLGMGAFNKETIYPVRCVKDDAKAMAEIEVPKATEQLSSFTDSRDGKKYKYVKIGKQTWMAQNLDYHGNDGYFGLCYGDEPQKKIKKPENCQKYGWLYDWNEAMKACPKGWHLPSVKEWQTLVDFAGGKEVAGKKLKAKSGWEEYDFSQKSPKAPKCKWTEEEIDNRGRVTVKEHDKCTTDEYGFSALPGGRSGDRDLHDGSIYYYAGYHGNWWSSNENEASGRHDYAYRRGMYYDFESAYAYSRGIFEDNNEYVYDDNGMNKSLLLSVRCLQD